MRVFVGTMHHGEVDFEQCKLALSQQTHPALTHCVVEGLPEREAHEKLFTLWNEAKHDHDLFLKVDADTVLRHSGVIEAYVNLFEADDSLTGVQAWLHDFMTDGLIYGLTCVRNTVTVATNVDPLYCDKADSGHLNVLRGDSLPWALRPAGLHCHYASELQAFRYGYHRGKKQQTDKFQRVIAAWKAHSRDRTRGMALAGFKMAHESSALSYCDPEFQDLYSRAQLCYDDLTNSFTMEVAL